MHTATDQAIKAIAKHAEEIKNDADATVSLDIGDVLRQGDLYIVRIPSLPIAGKPRKNRQLADGNTQGSRHILEGDVELFDADPNAVRAALAKLDRRFDVRDYQIGPVFRCSSPAAVTHPEHGNRTLAEGGSYACIFQRSLTADEREERAAD